VVFASTVKPEFILERFERKPRKKKVRNAVANPTDFFIVYRRFALCRI